MITAALQIGFVALVGPASIWSLFFHKAPSPKAVAVVVNLRDYQAARDASNREARE